MGEIFKLFGTIGVDNKSANEALDDTESKGEKTTGKLVGFFKKAALAIGSVFAIGKIIDFGKMSVEAAASAQALNAQFTQVFGNLEPKAQQMVESMGKQMNILPNRIKPTFSKITSMFKGLGLNTQEAMKKSEQATTLAADAAAFYDVSLEDASGSLTSFLKGNYEAGESIGIFANDTQMAQFAIKKGVVGSTKDWQNLDEATKQATRLDYANNMLKQAGAVGQASREADGYENVMGNLKQGWQDFLAIVGGPLLAPVVTILKMITQGLSTVGSAIGEATKGFDLFGSVMSVFNSSASSNSTIMTTLQGAWRSLVDAGTAIFNAISGFLMPIFQSLSSNAGNLQNIFGMLVLIFQQVFIVIQQVFTTVSPILNMLGQLLGQVLGFAIQAILLAISNFYNMWITYWPQIWAILQPIIAAIVASWQSAFPYLQQVATQVFSAIKIAISTAMSLVKSIISIVLAVIRGDWTSVFNNLRSITQTVFSAIKNIISNLLGAAKSYVSGAINAILGFFKKLSSLGGTVGSIFSAVYNAIKGPLNSAKSFIAGIIDKIKGLFNFTISWPDIPVPQFSIRPSGWKVGDLLKGKIPSLGISWHAKGGIFDQPTLLGGVNQLHGVGEAGAEAVAPIDTLLDYVRQAVIEVTGSNRDDGDIIVYQTINSPKELTPRETARQTKLALQDLAALRKK